MKKLLTIMLAIFFLTSCEKDINEQNERYIIEQIGEETFCGHILPSEEEMKRLDEIAKDAAKATMVYHIPVVFHIIYDGDRTHNHLPKASVIRSVKNLTDHFRNRGDQFYDTNIDMMLHFKPVGLEFHDGTAIWGTEYKNYGIKHSGSNGISFSEARNTLRTSNLDALHVFVPHRISPANIGGFASFMVTTNAICVIASSQFGSRVSNHEFGHVAFLYHTFQGNRPCDYVEVNPLVEGDRVPDTPVQALSYSCNQICDTTLHNVLGYTFNCQYNFTPGQRDRAHSLLAVHQPQFTTPLEEFNYDALPVLIEPQRTSSSSGYLRWHQWGADEVKIYVTDSPDQPVEFEEFPWIFGNFFDENSPTYNSNFQGVRYVAFKYLKDGEWQWYKHAWKVTANGPIQRITNASQTFDLDALISE